MKSTTLLSLALFAGSLPIFAADPQLLNMAMPNAQMFAGVNVEQAKTSPFGQFLLAKLPVNDDLQKFITATGFDPRNDLREILVVTSGGVPPGDSSAMQTLSGLFLAKGSFNVSQIESVATADGDVQLSTYSGVQLLALGHKGEGPVVAFVDSSTVVAGNMADVKAALDRRNQANVIAPDLMTRINQLSSTEDVWSVSNAALLNSLPMFGKSDSANGSAVLKGIQQASGGVKFGEQVQLVAQAIAQNSQDATTLSDVVKMLSSMVQMNGGKNGAPPALTDLLKNLVVSTDGSTVNVSVSVSESQLESIIDMAHGAHGVAQI